MTLHEASAVFLIVSSVLIGPIERRPQEKIIETCHRAMIEVGAKTVRGRVGIMEHTNWRIICIDAPSGLIR